MHLLSTLLRLLLCGGLLIGLPALAQTSGTPADTTLAAPTVDPAKSAERIATRAQALQDARVATERQRLEVQALQSDMAWRLGELKAQPVKADQVEQARVQLSTTTLKRDDLRADQTNSEQRLKTLDQAIRDLESREQLLRNPLQPVPGGADRDALLSQVQADLTQQRAEQDLERQHLEQIKAQADVVEQRRQLDEQWFNAVQEAFRQQQTVSRQEAQIDIEASLQRAQQAATDRAAQLAEQLVRERDTLPDWRRAQLELQSQIESERAQLLGNDMHLTRIDSALAELRDAAEGQAQNFNADTLRSALDRAHELRDTLSAAAALIERKLKLYAERQQLLEKQPLSGDAAKARDDSLRLLALLQQETEQRKQRVAGAIDALDPLIARIEQQYRDGLRRDLLERRQFPHSLDVWRTLLGQLAAVPQQIGIQIRLSVQSAVRTLFAADALVWGGLLLASALIAVGLLRVRRWASRVLERFNEGIGGPFSGQFIRIMLSLMRRNLVGLSIALLLLGVLWVGGMPQPAFGILATLVLLWHAIKAPVEVCWLLLAAPHLDPEQRRPKLFRGLAAALIGGGLVAAVTLIAHLIELQPELLDVFDRLFMIVLLTAAHASLHARALLIERVDAELRGRYWMAMLRLGTLLLPVTMLLTAAAGLSGYINLAWRMAWYLGCCVTILFIWLIARRLLVDLFAQLADYAIVRLGYGQLLTGELLRPFERLAHLLLIAGAGWLGLGVLEWTGDFAVRDWFVHQLTRPLFTIVGLSVSLYTLVAVAVTTAVVFWFAQWARAFSYRWLFGSVIDAGVRNSLSVFTQYFVVLVGVLTALNVLGIDLTAFAVFAGAVGVGIGLGLQGIANNFISGLLLLIERPLRSGDTVKIGGEEGEIRRIGMRSLTLKTFDNLEVIIPNADVIGSAFTNWTHSDNVIRTVLYFGVSYDADPHKVKVLLERVVQLHPAVLRDPPSLVLLWEFADSAVQFRVQYYVDMSRSSLLKTRSEIHFAVWDALKNAGIEIPFPQSDVHVRSWPAGGAPVVAPLVERAAPEPVTPPPAGLG
ncbi:potassium efflux system protein [Plasticicumulans acidivorans]|uniref:Potassium efflux system protein n=2 Tax=Plasticicumulans acidivorans TaxID=886464 RepID=A0A317MTV7_9GAMM|nr:potassium efflux system protein [Plasticicumulans acidivorans]